MARRFNHKELIMSALLTSYTYAEASKQSGVSVSTIARAMADPDFRRELEERRKQILDNTCMMLQTLMPKAVSTTNEIMEDPETSKQVRLNASDMILRHGTRLTELCSVSNTVDEMENKLDELNVIDVNYKEN